MSKYEPLWNWIREHGSGTFHLTWNEFEQILSFPIDHSFLNAKKELSSYGFRVVKIAMKGKIVFFEPINKIES